MFLNKLFIQRDLNIIVPKKGLSCILPYLDETSLNLRARLRTVDRNLPYCRLKVILRSKCRFDTLLCFKDSHEQKKPLLNVLSLYV